MKLTIITGTICLLLGAGLGTFLFPQIKEKQVEVQKEVLVKDVVTITKIVTRPDGSKEEVITVTDKSKENKQSTNTVTKKASNWHASVGAKSKIDKLGIDVYTIQIEKRILGDLFIGVTGSTDKTVGITVGMEF